MNEYKIKQDKKGFYISGIPGKVIYYDKKYKAQRYMNRVIQFRRALGETNKTPQNHTGA